MLFCTETELVDLLEKLWLNGGGDKPIVREWQLQREAAGFEAKYNKIQDDLDDVCGADDFVTGEQFL